MVNFKKFGFLSALFAAVLSLCSGLASAADEAPPPPYLVHNSHHVLVGVAYERPTGRPREAPRGEERDGCAWGGRGWAPIRARRRLT